MVFEFKKATKEQSRLRLALFGPSGSGKTYTALRLATGLSGKIAVVDTERGSASKYADRFEFDVLDLEAGNRDINAYCAAIGAAQSAGYDVLIIDSLTHAWHELLGEVDRLAKSKYRGNTWSAWSEGTPKQRKLVDAILDFDGHVIATMRTKTEWTTEKDPRTGKSKPIRVGLAPEQGKGIEYEFDLLMELSTEHVGTVSKDRTGKFQDAVIEKPGEDLGKELAGWLKTGSVPAPKDANEAIEQAYGSETGNNYEGQRRPAARTWPDVLINAIMDGKFARPEKHAKHMLNLSNVLRTTDEVDFVLTWARHYKIARADQEAEAAAAWADEQMPKAEPQYDGDPRKDPGHPDIWQTE